MLVLRPASPLDPAVLLDQPAVLVQRQRRPSDQVDPPLRAGGGEGCPPRTVGQPDRQRLRLAEPAEPAAPVAGTGDLHRDQGRRPGREVALVGRQQDGIEHAEQVSGNRALSGLDVAPYPALQIGGTAYAGGGRIGHAGILQPQNRPCRHRHPRSERKSEKESRRPLHGVDRARMLRP